MSNAQHTIRPGAEAFFLERGSVGVLLVHGYSGSPGELRPMGQALADQGYSVLAPLLRGHGSTPDALFNITWHDWLASARAGLEQLQSRCDTIVVAGFSMGGLLASVLAEQARPHGLILMAPALKLMGQPFIQLAGLASRFKPWYYPLARADLTKPGVRAAIRGFVPDADLDDPQVVAEIRKNARVPIGSVYQLVPLQRHARRSLPHVSVPTLIMQGRLDRTVMPVSAEMAQRLVGSRDKRLIWFERSDHQLPREVEREHVWRAAGEWIREKLKT